MKRYDVVVIGGGPAGSLVASLVRRQDPQRSVLVLEKDRLPRHHVGESLIPGIGAILARAGVLEELERRAGGLGAGVVRKVGIVYWWGDAARESWTADFRDPLTGRPAAGSYQVDRAVFDRCLLDHAASLGAEVQQGAAVHRVARTEDGFEIAYGGGEAFGSYVIDASGLARVLGRQLGIGRLGYDDMNNYAVYGYWTGSRRFEHGAPLGERETWTFVSTTRDGWCWHIPLDDGRASVGLVTSRDAVPGGEGPLRQFYLDNVRACHGIGELLAEASLVTNPGAPRELMAVRDWSSRAERFAGERWFAVGDAAAFVDPILTSGLVLASVGAAAAASALHTIWNAPDLDEELLRASYDETYADLAAGYHRLAEIWYRRNDKIRSWWWEARHQAVRGGASAAAGDMRAFLGLSLGLVRDPFAGLAAERGGTVDLVRPDKLLFAHHLFDDAAAIDAELARTLDRLTSQAAGEPEARARLYAHLMERWRGFLDGDLVLEPLEGVRRERYYTDRTLPHWRRETFVELRLRGGDPAVDRIVLAGDTDVDLPLGIRLADGSLRAALEAACADALPGSSAFQALTQRVWERVTQLDLRGWLHGCRPVVGADHLTPLLAGLRAGARWGVAVDVLGHSIELDVAGAARLRLIPRAHLGSGRVYATTGTAGVTYGSRELDPVTREVVDALIERLSDLERSAPDLVRAAWASLGTSAGWCFIVDDEGVRPSMPEQWGRA
jgi:flavin-dependent dehydrogenase